MNPTVHPTRKLAWIGAIYAAVTFVVTSGLLVFLKTVAETPNKRIKTPKMLDDSIVQLWEKLHFNIWLAFLLKPEVID